MKTTQMSRSITYSISMIIIFTVSLKSMITSYHIARNSARSSKAVRLPAVSTFSSKAEKEELKLPERLLQIANPIIHMATNSITTTKWNTVADIGTDHGLLACYLAPHMSKVFAIDRSELSLQGCKNNVANSQLQNKIEIMHGDGFFPLLKAGKSVDIVILAGTSATTVASIVSGITVDNCQDAFSHCDSRHIHEIQRMSNNLNISCIAIQPWPAELMHMLHLCALLIRSGWKMMEQDVCASNPHNYQLTTFFERSDNAIETEKCVDLDTILLSMPLVATSTSAGERKNAKTMQKYLMKQYKELSCRILKGQKLSDFSPLEFRQFLLRTMGHNSSTREEIACCKVLLALLSILYAVEK